MKRMSKQDISAAHLARLANLTLTAKEKENINPQLEETLESFSALDQIKELQNTSPTFQVTANQNVVRTDKAGQPLRREKILKKGKYFTAKL